ncbi:MAG: hypothetical protein Q7W02_21100 [Candidatus Rokubacteria bacterium]|nr:hypothetical protein [Candidatus Rokubacteria bacterium]
MGKVVYAAAMSHVLYPDYYGKNVGPHGRRMVEELIADDHLNVFSFDAIPASRIDLAALEWALP